MSEIVRDIITISMLCTGISLLIVALRAIIGKQTGAWWRSLIWTLLLIRLCVPIMIESPVGVIENNKLVNIETVEETDTSDNNISTEQLPAVNQNTDNAPIIQNFEPSDNQKGFLEENWEKIILYVYLLGVFIGIVIFIVKLVIVNTAVSKLRLCKNQEILHLFNNTKKRLGIKKRISLVIQNSNEVPLLCGIFRPKIIIPKDILQKADKEMIEVIFIHELMHYKRKDIARLWLCEFANILHWFNPAIYFIKKVIVADIELACDEKVLSQINKKDYEMYGRTLLGFSMCKKNNLPLVTTTNFTALRGKQLKERIYMIKKYNRSKILIIGVVLILLMTTVLVACTTLAKKDITTGDTSPENSTEESALQGVEATQELDGAQIQAKVIELNDSIIDTITSYIEKEIPIGDIIEEFSLPYVDGAFRMIATTSTDEYAISIFADENIDRTAIFDEADVTFMIDARDKWSAENPDGAYIQENIYEPYDAQRTISENDSNDNYPLGIYAVYYNNIREEIIVDLEEDIFKKAYEKVYVDAGEWIDLSQFEGTEEEFFTTDIYLNKNGEFHGGEIEILINILGEYALRFTDNGWQGVLAEGSCDDIIKEVMSITNWNFISPLAIQNIQKAEISIDDDAIAVCTDSSDLEELEEMLSSAESIGYAPKTQMYKPILTLTLNSGDKIQMYLDLENDLMLLGSSFHYDYGPGYSGGDSINNLPKLMKLFNIDSFGDVSQLGSNDISKLDIEYAMDVVKDYYKAIEDKDLTLLEKCVNPDRYTIDETFFDEFSDVKITLDTVYEYSKEHQTSFSYHLDQGDAMLIVLQVDYTFEYLTDSPNTPYNDGQYTEWNMILVRERLGSPWKIYDQGY